MKKTLKLLLYVLGGMVGVWLTAVLILPVGLPFLIGWLLSRLAQPLRPKRWHKGLSSVLCVSAVFAALCVLIWLLGRLLFGEVEHLAKRLPELLTSLSEPLQALHASLLRLAAKLPASFAPAAAEWIEKLFAGSSVIVTSLSEWLLGWAASLLSLVPDIVLFVLTALLSAYFFSAEDEKLRVLVKKHLPEAWLLRLKTLGKRLKGALGGYGKAQLYLAGISFGICFAGLLILRQRSALLLSLVIAIVDALPVFGAGTVLIPWGIFMFLRGDIFLAVGLLILYAVVSVTRTVLEPRFLGKQIGLHPLLTLLSLYAGYRLFGILGMILLPVAVMLLKQLYELSQDF